jgi:hypothetical protein
MSCLRRWTLRPVCTPMCPCEMPKFCALCTFECVSGGVASQNVEQILTVRTVPLTSL